MTLKPNPPPAALEAFARLICALSPEVRQISFHDLAANTLWQSQGALPTEVLGLIEQALAGKCQRSRPLAIGDGYALALPVLDALGAVAGAVRLTVDPAGEDPTAREPLLARLGATFDCIGAEFARCTVTAATRESRGAEWRVIEEALDAQRYELFVQPIMSLSAEGGLAHYEVLVRLRAADGTLLEPPRFLPSAVKRRLMPSIDRWVLRTLIVWLTQNRKVWSRRPAVFCLNVAPQSVTDRDFIAYTELLVRKSGLPPQALCFEVTEHFVASGSISVHDAMKRLQALGCEVALDDFGRQSASPEYLRQMPAGYFKIDATLISGAASDRVARATIAAIVRMAESLGVTTVAEAVEEAEQLEAVRSLGVHYAQGYLLGAPQALSEYVFTRHSRA